MCKIALYVIIGDNLYSTVFPIDRATCFPPPPRFRPNCNAARLGSGARALRRRPPSPRPSAAPWSATTACTHHRPTAAASRSAASRPRAASNRHLPTNTDGYESSTASNHSQPTRPANSSRSPSTPPLKMWTRNSAWERNWLYGCKLAGKSRDDSNEMNTHSEFRNTFLWRMAGSRKPGDRDWLSTLSFGILCNGAPVQPIALAVCRDLGPFTFWKDMSSRNGNQGQLMLSVLACTRMVRNIWDLYNVFY